MTSGSVGDDGQQAGRHRDLVAHEVALGDPQRRPEDLAEVRHLEANAAGELEHADAGRRRFEVLERGR